MVAYHIPEDLDEKPTPTCPLCASTDHVERPMVRHLALHGNALTTSWHCAHCQASYTFPEPASEQPMRFGESHLA